MKDQIAGAEQLRQDRRKLIEDLARGADYRRLAVKEMLERYARERSEERARPTVPAPRVAETPPAPKAVPPAPRVTEIAEVNPVVPSKPAVRPVDPRVQEFETRLGVVEDGLTQIIDRFTEQGDWRVRLEPAETQVRELNARLKDQAEAVETAMRRLAEVEGAVARLEERVEALAVRPEPEASPAAIAEPDDPPLEDVEPPRIDRQSAQRVLTSLAKLVDGLRSVQQARVADPANSEAAERGRQ
jgi:uncharacterized coiled-coil protein SlyX